MRAPSAPPSASERRVWTVPNALSLFRLATMPVFAYLFATGREEAGFAVFAAGASTDFFDGYIARRTNSVTEFGRLLDPLADRVLIIALAVALVARGTLPLWLALTVIARDVILLSMWPLLERRKIERIRVNFVGKTATALLLSGLGGLAWSETTFPLHRIADELGLLCTSLGGVLYWVAGLMYARIALSRVRGSELPS